MKIAAAYIRVSTDDQTEYSPVAQLNEIKKYAASHDLLLDDRYIYTEEGISGRSAKKRPQFNEMIAASKQSPPPFQTILLWKFSRFARNQEESIVYKTMLRKSGVDVISVSEPLSEGPFGSLIERIIEWMDEYYSIRLSGEVLRGMTEKARRGEFQSAPPFGYAKLPGLPLTIVENEAAIIRMIFDNYDAGGSFFSIARKLNAMGITTKRGNPFENRTIEYMIRNPVYIGCARWTPTGKTVSKRIYDSSDTMIVSSKDIPAIISKEQFERVNERACKERRHRKRNSRPAEAKKHWLSGILHCAECGASMVYAAASSGFQCSSYSKGKSCVSHYISASKMESAVLEAIEDLCETGDFTICIKRTASDQDSSLQLMQQELDSLKKMFDRAKSAYLAGIDTQEEYQQNKLRIQRSIDAQKQKMESHKQSLEQNQKTKHEHSLDHIRSAYSLLISDASDETKASVMAETFEKITFSRPSNKLVFYIFE